MKRRIWIRGTATGALAILAGCGSSIDDDLVRSYLGKMDEVSLTPRNSSGAPSSTPTTGSASSTESSSGHGISDVTELILPSILIDLRTTPPGANHLFDVHCAVTELRYVKQVGDALLDLKVMQKQIGITDILRYIGIDEQAVLADLRLQLQNQLNSIFRNSFRLKVSSSQHSPADVRFDCSFFDGGFSGNGFMTSPVSCRAEMQFGAPLESLRILLRGP